MSNHITYFDFLRGIAIVMVVLIHCTGIINFEGANNIMTMAFRECLNCAVPIFIAISGYFMCLKPVDNPKDYLSFIKKICSGSLGPNGVMVNTGSVNRCISWGKHNKRIVLVDCWRNKYLLLYFFDNTILFANANNKES